MATVRAVISRKGKLIWKELVSVGRGGISIAIGTIAGALSSGGTVSWKPILVTAGSTILMNIAQRIGGTSAYPAPPEE